MALLFGILLILLLVFAGVGMLADTQADIVQAQAQIEAARANQEIARAAQISSFGLTIVSILLALALVAIIGLVIYVLYLRNHQKKWKPCPNAGWERLEPGPAARPLSPMDQLIQLELLRSLRGVNPPAADYKILVDNDRRQTW